MDRDAPSSRRVRLASSRKERMMRNRLLALTAALGIAVLASWTPRAEATTYCSDLYCAGKPEDAPCPCPPGTDKEGNPSTCQEWNSISAHGCWYE
jgi:hypothetical protein